MPEKQYGVLVPHFGEHASRDRIIRGAQQAEAFGFDSVWLRDHVVYPPHGHENQDLTFIDPFVAMSAIASGTERLILATAALIPHRHPVHSALLLASLDFIAGPNRIIAGWGLGAFDHEFESVGMGGWERKEVLKEQIDIFRLLWSGEEVTHKGQFYQFDKVQLRPSPPPGSIQLWYCGGSPAAARRAVQSYDGWMPGKVPRREFRKVVGRLLSLSDEAHRTPPRIGMTLFVSPGKTVEEGVRHLNMSQILAWADQLNPSYTHQSYEDLDGAVIAGPAAHIVEEVRKYEAEGVVHIVFDLRHRFADWEDCLRLIGEEVLPQLKDGS